MNIRGLELLIIYVMRLKLIKVLYFKLIILYYICFKMNIMRINLLLITLMLGLVSDLKSQITITSSDMPNVNDTIRYSVTNNIQGQNPELTGSNYTWDYSMLASNSQRVDTFFSVTSTPPAYQYYFNNSFQFPAHKSNFAVKGNDILPAIPFLPIAITDVLNFIKKTSTTYENVGFGSKINGITFPTRKVPVDVEYVFPLNYNDSSFSSSEFVMNIPTLAYYGETMDRETTVDGWGQLTTPLGTFDVLRVKSVLTKLDTLFLDTIGFGFTIPLPQEIEYKWLTNNKSTPVLKILTSQGIVRSIEYQDTVEVVGVAEINLLNGVSVYPNPTKEFAQVVFNSKVAGKLDYNVKDINGRVIMSNMFLANIGKNLFIIDFRNNQLSKGVYFIELIIGEQLTTHKLVISE